MELPRTDFLRTENYTVKNREELLNILREYVSFCDKRKYKVGTTLSVYRYYEYLNVYRNDTIFYFRNYRKKKTYTISDIRKKIEFLGKSLFWKKTHSELKDVIFHRQSLKARHCDIKNIKTKLYVDSMKLRKTLVDGSCRRTL